MAEKKNELTFGESLKNELTTYQDALPQGFNQTRFVQNGLALLNGNKTLIDYMKEHGPTQIKQGMMKAAYLGLDAMNKEFYLVPYKGTIRFATDYRGEIKLAKKYSIRPVLDVYAKLIREDDEFEECVVGGKPSINFKPVTLNSKPIIGAFAVTLFKDGGMAYEVMSKADIDVCKSKAMTQNVWKDFYGEMAKKTVLHRMFKQLELEFENPQQVEIFNEDTAIITDTQEIVERDIEENANTVDFDTEDENIIDVDEPNFA